jgi:RimJ/RimL family protein N-acetyltransferase
MWPPETVLRGNNVTLRPVGDAEALAEAVKDGELWNLWFTRVPTPDEVLGDIQKRIARREQGTEQSFAVLNGKNEPIGMTAYIAIDPHGPRLEIGKTWYRASSHRAGVNQECKLLLLQQAFEELECIAVEFRTHFYNWTSRRSLEAFGARQDGVLRNHGREQTA